MFGKDRLRDKIRDHAARTAKEIVSALMQEFQQFIHPLPQKDDATLVVIKVEG
jgi:sigma-B regulation protein RsbU (phosphoserine phosphatase)